MECDSQAYSAGTNDPSQSILDKYGRTTGYPLCVGIGPHTELCRAKIEHEMLATGDARKLETRQEQEGNPREPEASPKKSKTGESDRNPGGTSSSAAEETSKRKESERASNLESSNFDAMLGAVNDI